MSTKTKKNRNRATGFATQWAESVRQLTEFEASAKLAAEQRADMKLQVVRSAVTVEHGFRSLTDSSRRAELVEKEAPALMSQLS